MNSLEFLRQFKLFNYAVFDFAVTFIAVYFLSPFLSRIFLKVRINIPRKNWLFLALPLSIPIHVLVGEITPMTENFLDLNNYYLLKIIILILVVFGLKDIKIIKKK
jgi:hypothetical protein